MTATGPATDHLNAAAHAWRDGFRWREALGHALEALVNAPESSRDVLSNLGRLFDDSAPVRRLFESLDRSPGRVGIFGCTELARQLVDEFGKREFAYLVDNDPAKHGTTWHGVDVVSFEHARRDPPNVMAIASVDSLDEIADQIATAPEFRRTRVVSIAGDRTITLSGCRAIEWSWVTTRMPNGPGRALDFGCAQSHLAMTAAEGGFDVTAIDLKPVTWLYEHPRLKFVQGNLCDLRLEARSFDLIINCSTIEHVGLSGRYMSDERPDGDLDAMRVLRRITKPGGTHLLTIPVGQDTVVRPLHRIYGPARLPTLLDGWRIEAEEYWVKNTENRWQLCTKDEALAFKPVRNAYALGCFVLHRP